MPETLAKCSKPKEGYAKPLADGFDTVQECYCTVIPKELAERMDKAQRAGLEKHEGQGMTFIFGGETFQIWTGGSKGNRWVLENDDFQLHFRTDKPGYNISVRYLAPGLWEHGIDALRERAQRLLRTEVKPMKENWCTISRVDYCFDFHCEGFSAQQLPGMIAKNMLLTSGVNAGIVFSSRKNETLTIGITKKASLTIQVYDKGKELWDKPGKDWMHDIWAREGYKTPEIINDNGKKRKRARDVWRVEVRFAGDFLKDRNIRTFEKFRENIQALLREALMRRRMVVPKKNGMRLKDGYRDQHKERWDLHPLWAAVMDKIETCDRYVPVGRMITMKREEYIQCLRMQQAGVGRSLSIAIDGAYDELVHRTEAVKGVKLANADKKHHDKIDKCMERQLFMDEAG